MTEANDNVPQMNVLSNPAGQYPFVNVPGLFTGGRMTFTKDHIDFRDRAYNYSEVSGVYYNSMNLSINFIPVSQAFYFGFRFGEQKLNISFGTAFYLGHKKKKAEYLTAVTLIIQLIEPRLIAKMVREIFEQGKTVNICGIDFTKEGYSKKKLFGGIDKVLWTDRVYIPNMDKGYVFVFRDKNGRSSVFKTLSMQALNAVLLPGLVQACYDATHKKQ